MTHWRPLAEDLDPRVAEFTALMRHQLDRSGTSVPALADATGYSRSSWDRYLNGRLLPPRGAVDELAAVTGADPDHLGVLWEFTERAWSRAEARHDITMEAVRVADARAALGEFGPPPAVTRFRRHGSAGRAGHQGRPGGRRIGLFAAGVGAVVLAVVGATFAVGGASHGGRDGVRAGVATPSSPAPSAPPQRALGLPSGVKCGGSGCEGRDPQAMGCGDANARTVAATWVGGTYLEMRYSEVCGAVWARVSLARDGDRVSVTTTGTPARTRSSRIGPNATTYTTMLAVPVADGARACAQRADGARGCTPPGRTGAGPRPSSTAGGT